MRAPISTLVIIVTFFSLLLDAQKIYAGVAVPIIVNEEYFDSRTDWKPEVFNDFLSELHPNDQECISLANNESTIRALLIGANEYKFTEFSLKGPVNDVELIKHALLTRGILTDNIQVRTNGEAVRKTVIEDFSRLLLESQCGDEIVLYLGGQAMKTSVPGYAGERWPIDRPDQKELIQEEKEQNIFSFEDMAYLTALELQNFVLALRSKGINVFAIIDVMDAREFDLEKTVLDSIWKCCFNDQTPSHKIAKGYLTVFYSPSNATEFTRDGKTYGNFSFWVGTALAQNELVEIRDIVENVYENYHNFHIVDAEGRKKFTAKEEKLHSRFLPSFVSTLTPSQQILNPNDRKKSFDKINITLTAPSDEEMRGVSVLSSGKQKLTGRISLTTGLVAVVVAGKTADLRNDGRFTVELPLKRGDNQISVVAIYNNRPHYVEQIIVHSDAGQYEVMQSPRTFAILIGNQNYSEKSGFTELKTPHRDIEALEQILAERYGMRTFIEESNGNKRSLVIRDASRRDIFDVFSDISKVAREDDSVLIFYAGHGNEKEFMKGVRTAYWIPANSEIEFGTSDWVSADDLNKHIAGIQARHVLVIADSCYSGVLAETRDKMELIINNENKDRYLSEMSRKKSRYIVSSGGDEPVSDGGGDGHSIFARMLLTALENPPASIFTIEQIFHSHLKQKVANKSLQIPQMHIIRNTGHEDGNFVFFRQDSDFH